ncbi:unnamed protein product [Rotaria sp. Silwood1]|nr:unnamed protein product [Rotaria sp. Silwood1]CAF1418672.1 unnamed protein product [Rotaria sp. Silwood1]CAF3669989.1 unnamed protein product [Rotaria sp. Silwood1]CAF4961112.1 unnamed protein product [Rotaria sp. Silwood1]
MQLHIFLILFCIITIFFIELNNGASTKNTTSKKNEKNPSKAKPLILGGHTSWTTKIKPKHKKIFNDYKNIIFKKLREIHKISNTFDLKPDKFSTQIVGGINYLYLIKLPINKYAFVSIHHRIWRKDHYGKEENVHIRPQTYELNDKNI